MVRIRLRRVVSKGQPSYRIVIADSRSPRNGRFIEKIGFYNPRTEPATIEVDESRALTWLQNGAQPSESVERLFRTAGTLARFERLRQGEALEALVSEAESNKIVVDPRTRRDDLWAKRAGSKSAAGEAVAAE